jgi:hypothetical protein
MNLKNIENQVFILIINLLDNYDGVTSPRLTGSRDLLPFLFYYVLRLYSLQQKN